MSTILEDDDVTAEDAREQAEREWLRSPRAIADTIDADVAQSEAGEVDPWPVIECIRGGVCMSMGHALVAVMHCTGDYESVVLALRAHIEHSLENTIAARAAGLLQEAA